MLLQVSFAKSIETVLDNYYNNGQAEVEQGGFSDMDQAPWAREAVDYLAKYGAVATAENFEPNREITRAEFIKILILAFGLYDAGAASSFEDVPKESWQYPYVSSAKKLGIALGISENYFGADEFITREQLVVLAYKTALLCNVDLSFENEKGQFADYHLISDYAKQAALTFQNCNIISGDMENYFHPKNNATRAEACKIIYQIVVKALENFDDLL